MLEGRLGRQYRSVPADAALLASRSALARHQKAAAPSAHSPAYTTDTAGLGPQAAGSMSIGGAHQRLATALGRDWPPA